MIISDPNKRKPKLTILIKQVGHESVSFLNTNDFPGIVEMATQAEPQHD